MPIPQRAGEQRLRDLFPDVVPDPPDGVFELGLVLGGTVSAGAYTAGALDFLLQALEAWNASSPRHKVVIRTAAGSSGGAVCAAILGVLSNRTVPHVGDGTNALPAEGADSGNPLWDLWINRFDIRNLLATEDIDSGIDYDAGTGGRPHVAQHVPSLLNCLPIDRAGTALARFAAAAGGPSLPYFATPFRIAVTIANVRGIPYKVSGVPTVGEFSGAAFIQHDDFAWFAFPNGADSRAALPTGKREDEFWIEPARSGSGFVGYQTLVDFATASGSMPVGLVARALSRPSEHYHYRPVVRPVKDWPDGDTGAPVPGYRVDWPEPDWTALPDAADNVYAFTGVDGGTFNNDPVSLVHRGLAGLVGHNPRGKSDTRRALLMIDPLANKSDEIGKTGRSLLSVVGHLVTTIVGGARYLTADMELFADEDVFSRFQMVPFRRDPDQPGTIDRVGEEALAGTSFYAAAGWCARAFRVHDYLLGRSNMQEYLRKELVLAGDNPLFGEWDLGMRQDFAMDEAGDRIRIDEHTPGNSYFLPIIPDRTGLQPAQPDWPKGALDPGSIEQPIRSRLDAVIRRLLADNGGGGPLPWLLGILAVPGVVGFIASKLVDEFRGELRQAGLI